MSGADNMNGAMNEPKTKLGQMTTAEAKEQLTRKEWREAMERERMKEEFEEISTLAITKIYGDEVVASELWEKWGRNEVKEFLSESEDWEYKQVTRDGKKVKRWVCEGNELKSSKMKDTGEEAMYRALAKGYITEERLEEVRKKWREENVHKEKWERKYKEIDKWITYYTFGLFDNEQELLRAMICITYNDYMKPGTKEEDFEYMEAKRWFAFQEKLAARVKWESPFRWPRLVYGLKAFQARKNDPFVEVLLEEWFEFEEGTTLFRSRYDEKKYELIS